MNREVTLDKKNNTVLKRAIAGNGLSISIIILLVLLAIAAILVPKVFQMQNLDNVLRLYAPAGIMAIGLSLVMFTAEIDISVGAIMNLSMAAGALVLDMNEIGAFFLILGVGVVCGLVNGILVTKTKTQSLMITIGTLSVYNGLAAILVNAQPKYISNIYTFLNMMGKENVLGLPIPFFICVVLAVIFCFLMAKTRFGKQTYYVGANKRAAWMGGVDIDKVRIICFTISGLLAALSGPLLAAQIGSASIDMGTGYEVTAISIAVLGGVSLDGGRGSVLGTLCGMITMGILLNMLSLLGLGTYAAKTLQGALIIGIVCLYGFLRRRANR